MGDYEKQLVAPYQTEIMLLRERLAAAEERNDAIVASLTEWSVAFQRYIRESALHEHPERWVDETARRLEALRAGWDDYGVSTNRFCQREAQQATYWRNMAVWAARTLIQWCRACGQGGVLLKNVKSIQCRAQSIVDREALELAAKQSWTPPPDFNLSLDAEALDSPPTS